jgi:peptidoglycan/LPS O-acetylase OafA/YrhL
LLLFPVPAGPAWQAGYDLAALVIVIPLLVALGVSTEPDGRVTPIFKFAGVTSYAIYILHDPLVTSAHRVVPGLDLNPFVAEGAFVLMVIGLAWLADRIYDAPVRRWLSRIFV